VYTHTYVDTAWNVWMSATPIADRCIKQSTQTLAVERPYWIARYLSMRHNHKIPSFQQVSSSHLCPARVVPVNCKCCYCEVETSEATTAQPQSGRPHKLTERDRRALKHVKNCLSSVATLTTRVPNCLWKQRTRSVHLKLYEMGFHGWAAANKPKITMGNAKRQLGVV
jgi:hypothetical protein